MRFLIRLLIVVGALLALAFIGFRVMQHQTKKASPEATVSYDKGGLKMEVFYNRPSKKGRTIFGGLVPYGQVWRTGANEATTFSTDQDLTIGGKTLPAGKYSLWTVPGEQQWKVIFNKKMYSWGVDFSTNASREAAEDVLTTTVPVEVLPQEVEMFTISLEDTTVPTLVLSWDRTRVAVPLK